MTAIESELDELISLATRLNRTRQPRGGMITVETWLIAREEIARGIARCVGRLRRELGIKEPSFSFSAPQKDLGLSAICQRGRVIRIERRAL